MKWQFLYALCVTFKEKNYMKTEQSSLGRRISHQLSASILMAQITDEMQSASVVICTKHFLFDKIMKYQQHIKRKNKYQMVGGFLSSWSKEDTSTSSPVVTKDLDQSTGI